MRIAAASDLHGTYRDVWFPPADIVVFAGDITRSGTIDEVAQFGAWLRTLPYAAKIVVSGNHDAAMQADEARTRALLAGARYLVDETVEVGGRRFYGSPWVLPYSGAFNLTGAELARKWSAIPPATDVLITHMPPYSVRDAGGDGRNKGDRGLLARVGELQLRAHLFGHIHEGHGRVRARGATFANVAICDRVSRPIRPVTVLDL